MGGGVRQVQRLPPLDVTRSGRPCLLLHVLVYFQQPALKVLRPERSGFGDQLAGRVDPLPNVPQQRAAHPALPQVVDHALAVRLLPVGHGFQTRIDLSHGLVAQLEEIGVEGRQVVVADGLAGHGAARHLTHRVGVVFMFHAEVLCQRGIEELGRIARGVDLGMTGPEGRVDANALAHVKMRLPRQLDVGPDAEPGHHGIRHDLLLLPVLDGTGFQDEPARTRGDFPHLLSRAPRCLFDGRNR